MLNALSNPAVATAAPPAAAKASVSPTGDEPATDGFAQALDDAAAKQPKSPKSPGGERLRGTARPAPGTEPVKAAPQPMPAVAEAKDRQTQPPQAEAEPDKSAAQCPPPLQGLAALLAELRAAVPATEKMPTEGGAKASTTLAPQSDKRAAGGTANGIDNVGAAHGPANAASLPAAGAGNEGMQQGMHNGTQDGKSDSFALQLAAATAPDNAAPRIDGVPLPQAAAAAIASAAAAAVQAEAQLPAAPGSAAFGPQLGAQISTFVQGGIEHARLHLNPADMGPVSVQIQLEGQTAQVHLSAENPHTRQALEQALPQLAGSLREAGITLSGGGVFEQPRQSGGTQDQPDTDGKRGRSDDALPPEPPPFSTRHRGVVDLVA